MNEIENNSLSDDFRERHKLLLEKSQLEFKLEKEKLRQRKVLKYLRDEDKIRERKELYELNIEELVAKLEIENLQLSKNLKLLKSKKKSNKPFIFKIYLLFAFLIGTIALAFVFLPFIDIGVNHQIPEIISSFAIIVFVLSGFIVFRILNQLTKVQYRQSILSRKIIEIQEMLSYSSKVISDFMNEKNDDIARNKVIDLIQNAAHLNQESDDTAKGNITDIESTAEKYETKSSEYLAGVIGGGIGLSGGFAISLAGVSIVFSGPIGLIMGVAGAILLWRGKGQHKIERANKKDNLAKSKILANIRNLPDDAPQETRNRLWKLYDKTTEIYETEVLSGLSDSSSKFDVIHTKNKMPAANKV